MHVFGQGRKLEYPVETPETQGEHASSMHTKQELNLQPERCEANVVTTKPSCPYRLTIIL